MTAGDFSTVKISRPRTANALPRERVYRLLDAGRSRPLLWVSGPAGAGKTTLVACYLDSRRIPGLWYQLDESDADLATFFYYLGLAAKKAAPRFRKPLPLLTPEYLLGIGTFAKRFFEALCRRLVPPFLIVLDNYQDVPAGSGLHELLLQGLSVLPPGAGVAIISRTEPLSEFNALRLKNSLFSVDADELRFTEQESSELIAVGGQKGLRSDLVAKLYQRTQGWAAGLVLFIDLLKTGEGELLQSGQGVPGELFDYFAGEVFNKADEDTQQFLLKTAFLPSMTASMAERMSGISQAGRILADLTRRNYFILRSRDHEPAYQYHPLFREFLLDSAGKAASREDIVLLQGNAARLLEETGRIEDAASLYGRAERWADLSRLIVAHAPAMIAQGRQGNLLEWIELLPEREREPWVLVWHAHCVMFVQPDEGRKLLERAFLLFRRRQDRDGMFIALSRAADMSLQEGSFSHLDRPIALFHDMLRNDAAFSSDEMREQVTVSMFNALSLRQPWHAKAWEEKAFACMRQSRNKDLRIYAGFYLVIFSFYMGNMARAGQVVRLLKEESQAETVSPLSLITIKATEAIYAYVAADFPASLMAVEEGLRLSEETGIHIWDKHLLGHGCGACLSMGNLERAKTYFLRMSAGAPLTRPLDRAYYHFNAIWYGLAARDIDLAQEHVQLMSELLPTLGSPFGELVCCIMSAQVQSERREWQQASRTLVRCRKAARRVGSAWFLCMAQLVEAHLAFERSDGALHAGTRSDLVRRGTDRLRRALSICRERGIRNVYGWRSSVMTRLLVRALEAGIETEFVREMIRERRLLPETPPVHLANWPWPIKIHTLGRFSISLNDRPVRFTGRVRKKPLDLLKALIAFGGRQVSEYRVTEALWPDAVGDAAHSAFSTTLQRLRRLLGRDDALLLHDGKLTLDPRQCWVDIWAFERMLDQADEAWRQKDTPAAVRFTEQALALYSKGFLPEDEEQSWAISMHERLLSKFIRAVGKMGALYAQTGRYEQAIETYRKGIEADNLAEELYRRLMVCYAQLGRRAESLAVYNRCRKVLMTVIGIEPSQATEELAAKLRANKSKTL